jgi:transposase
MSNFRPIARQTGFLLPPSVDEWLPEKHLARFVVEVIDGLDVRVMSGSYRGSGSASYHPSLLLGILVYGYATGVFSSCKLERATYDSVAFRFIAANQINLTDEESRIRPVAGGGFEQCDNAQAVVAAGSSARPTGRPAGWRGSSR